MSAPPSTAGPSRPDSTAGAGSPSGTRSPSGGGSLSGGASLPGSRPAGTGPGSLEQEEPRSPRDFGIDVRRLRRLRRIVFAILALPLLLLGLLALKFVSLPLTQAYSDAAYDRADYPTAIERLAPVWVANWFEPYLPHLTRGTDLLQQGKDAEAEKELRVALETWTEGSDLNQPLHAQCKILNNLAISIERQAVLIQDPAERGDRLFEAEQMLAPCAGGGGQGEGDGQGQGQGQGQDSGDKGTTGENGKRIEDERKEADEQAGKDPADRPEDEGQDAGSDEGEGGAPPSGTPGQREDPTATGPTEEATTQGEGDQQKKDELEERNRKANEGGEGESSGGTEQSPARPW